MPDSALLNPDPQDWIAKARALTPLLAAAAPRIEAACELPDDVLDALHGARMFRMLLPRSVGGGELELGVFFQAIQALAEGDASTAWCVVQNSGCSLSAAYLAPEAAREIFGDARAVLAWGFVTGTPCRAVPAPGGWKATGTWGFGSGSRHATWLGGHCKIEGAGERTMLFPRASATIKEDSWNVVGLRGTGSDTYSVTDLAVPAAHAVVARATPQAEPEPERREQGTLYRFSAVNVYQCGFAAVALGLARAMLDDFIALAKKKTPAAGPPLREDHTIQARIALSEARLGASRAWIEQILGEMQAECAASGQIGMENRIRLRLASTHAIHEARQVVEDSYADAGATAIFEAGPFERRLRDMHAVSQQIQASATHYQSVGQYYLGLQPNLRFI